MVVQVDDETSTIDCEFPATDESGAETGACEEGPSPIAPEAKELAWGAGSFIVLALLMRFYLFPRLKKGIEARKALISDGHERADSARAAARAEVAQYESSLATVKHEANERIEAARQILEAERAERIEAVNAEIAEQRAAARAEVNQARDAAQADVVAAVTAVTGDMLAKATGREPDSRRVRAAVDSVVGTEVTS